MFIKIAYLTINIFFFLVFIVNFVIGLVRDLRYKKALKRNPQTIAAYIRQIDKVKNRIYMLVEFQSEHNRLNFTTTYEFFDSDLKGQEFNEGDQIDLIYNDISSWKRVMGFPLLIKSFKIKLEKGPLLLNIMLILFSIWVNANTISIYVKNNVFSKDVAFTGEGGVFNQIYVIIMVFVYAMVLSYVVVNIIEMPKKDMQNYLKLYGNVAKARVKTYKFGRAKNSKGNKESLITIEFSTNTGEQVETKLNSFLYTETQQEYIDILYDPKRPKCVVFLRP
jgi:hypothetical protein